MKVHYSYKEQAFQHLMHSISLLANQDEACAFFSDLCTPAELEAMTDRWQVVPLLQEGIPYRSIHEQTGVSVTTITRVARFLTRGNGGYALMTERVDKT